MCTDKLLLLVVVDAVDLISYSLSSKLTRVMREGRRAKVMRFKSSDLKIKQQRIYYLCFFSTQGQIRYSPD